jgi:putative methyltransferase (TIGR04325 family)
MKIISVRFEEKNSFEEARSETSGYNNTLLTEELPNFKHSACMNYEAPQAENTSNVSGMAAFLSAASQYGSNDFDVIDIGGSTGGHYGFFKKLYRGNSKFRWHIVETSVQANYGRNFITDPDLFFYDDISDINVEKASIVHFGGVLQYLPDPMEFIDKPEVRKSDFLIINRITLIPGSSIKNYAQFVTYDKGDMSYPGRAFGINFLQDVIERTHKIEMNWVNHHEVFRLSPETICTGGGMLCRRKGL